MNAKQLLNYLREVQDAGHDLETIRVGILADKVESSVTLLDVQRLIMNGETIVVDVGLVDLASKAPAKDSSIIKKMPERHVKIETIDKEQVINKAVKELLKPHVNYH